MPGAEPPRRERADAARNRQRVLVAARRLFAERGLEAVSMSDVAEAAGVAKGTVFHRFGDRSGLALALLDEHERELQERILHGEPPLGPGAPAPERLAALLAALVRFNEDHGHLLAAVETEAQRLRTGSYLFWRSHAVALLAEAGVSKGRTREALGDAVLGAVAPEVHRYQREVQGLGLKKITAAAQTIAFSVCGGR
jgi:AcrR family transcriptional regulator